MKKKKEKVTLKLKGYKEGARGHRRHVENNERLRKNVVKLFAAYAERLAADRPKYVADFLQCWKTCADQLNSMAETALIERFVELPLKLWQKVLAPYGTIMLLRYVRLMDHLNLEEKENYLAICELLNRAWQHFFSAALTRHPDAKDLIARLEATRQNLHDAVVPLFTGEAPAVLTPTWANSYEALENSHREFAEALRA